MTKGITYPEQGIDTVLVVEPLLRRLRKVALQANHDEFWKACQFELNKNA